MGTTAIAHVSPDKVIGVPVPVPTPRRTATARKAEAAVTGMGLSTTRPLLSPKKKTVRETKKNKMACGKK